MVATNIVQFPEDPENYQQASSVQGKAYEDACVTILKQAGWFVVGIHMIPGLDYSEIDIVAEDPDGNLWWIECKGSWRGKSQGLKRGDTVKKLLGDAYDLMDLRFENPDSPIGFMVMTSHLPGEGQNGYHMIRRALAKGVISRVWCTTTGEVWE